MSGLFRELSSFNVYSGNLRLTSVLGFIAAEQWLVIEPFESERKESAVPADATLASVRAAVHPFPLKHPPIAFREAISM